jgi:beta-1,4-mannosyltransferase
VRSAAGPPVGIVHFPPEVDVNPYTRLYYGGLARYGFRLVPDARFTLRWLWRSRTDVSVLHFHWCPNKLYEVRRGPASARLAGSWSLFALYSARLLAARLIGYRIVWTIHEIYPHDSLSRRLDRLAARVLVRASHVLLVHDRPTAARARRELGPQARTHLVPHGSYAGFYARGRSRDEVRAELGIPLDAFAFLCFGTLKPYKEIELLLEAFRSLRDPRAVLVVAGRARDENAAAAVRAAADDPRIRPLLDHVPDERVAELYGACDVAVLPRRDGWTSGSLILALSQGLPVVAARAPAYEELVGDAGWFFAPGDPSSLREALEAALREADRAAARGAKALARTERLSWDECAALTARLLLEATAPGGRA